MLKLFITEFMLKLFITEFMVKLFITEFMLKLIITEGRFPVGVCSDVLKSWDLRKSIQRVEKRRF